LVVCGNRPPIELAVALPAEGLLPEGSFRGAVVASSPR
jgi:hypothetical protein